MPKDYSGMTPEQLLEANRPYLDKLNRRERLTDEEEDEHYAILAEARKQMDARRAAELAERQKTHAPTEAPVIGKSTEHLWFRKIGE